MFKVQGIRMWTPLGLFVSPLQRISWPAPPKASAFSREYRTPVHRHPHPWLVGCPSWTHAFSLTGKQQVLSQSGLELGSPSSFYLERWPQNSETGGEFRNKVQNLETKINAAVDSPLVPCVQLVPTPAWEPCSCLGPEK